MIRYLNGLWDTTNNVPIVRRGITASAPYLDHQGRQEFVIDAACFPGSSGLPSLLGDDNSYSTRDGFVFSGRRKLLGVLYGGRQTRADREIIVSPDPSEMRQTARTT